MSGDQIITFGRYKNKKTFNQVLNEDREYCEGLLSMGQSYSKTANTDDFTKYLKEKLVISDARRHKAEKHYCAKPDHSVEEVLIRELYGERFTRAFKPLHKEQFNKILNSSDIVKASVHEKSELRLPDGCLGFFYGYVFAKCATETLNVRLFEDYDLSKRFPVELKWDDLGGKNVDIIEYFDKGYDTDIIEELDGYLKSYYFEVNTREEIRNFLRLISESKNCILTILLNVDVLKNKKRYWVDKLKKWLFLYLVCKEQKITEYGDDIRYCSHEFDLFSDIENLISFVQSFRKYSYYKGDICGIIEDIMNMAQLKHNSYSQCFNDKFPPLDLTVGDIDTKIIKNIEAYVRKACENKTADTRVRINMLDFLIKNKEQFQNCKKCKYYSLERQLRLMEECIEGKKNPEEIPDWIDKSFLSGTISLIIDRSIIHFCYSRISRTLSHFYHLVIYAALLEEVFEELIIYNGYLGEECRIRIVEDKEAVKNFIRTYRHPDTLREELLCDAKKRMEDAN